MITKKIRVYGIVQGVGFRPTVSRHAAAAGITGSVCNKGPYVEIFAQGEEKCSGETGKAAAEESCHIEDQYRRCKRGRIREIQ